jgi:hypothetical protein
MCEGEAGPRGILKNLWHRMRGGKKAVFKNPDTDRETPVWYRPDDDPYPDEIGSDEEAGLTSEEGQAYWLEVATISMEAAMEGNDREGVKFWEDVRARLADNMPWEEALEYADKGKEY